MADEVYKNKSIINIRRDSFTVSTGTVTRQGSTLVLDKNSRCTFTYSYDTDKPLTSTKLKVNYNITPSNNNSTRYNNHLQITLNIDYYEGEYNNSSSEMTYRNGKKQSIQIMPYTNREDKGAYKEEIIDLESNYIKRIQVNIAYYDSGSDQSSVVINSLGIYQTIFGDENSMYEDFDIDEYRDDLYNMMDQYMAEHTDLVIPGLTQIPDINTVPDGYTFRLISASTLPIGGQP